MTLKEAAARWARENKTGFTNELLEQSGARPHRLPSAIFMAGLPGAGKSELAQGLVSVMRRGVVLLDMDEIARKMPDYQAARADEFRAGATILLERVFDTTIRRKLDFILDGTFSAAKAVENVCRALKRGYTVKVLLVCQEPEVAWKFTKARELVEHRAISLTGFVEAYCKVYENMRKLEGILGDNSSLSLGILLKGDKNELMKWRANAQAGEIDEFWPMKYNKETLVKNLESI